MLDGEILETGRGFGLGVGFLGVGKFGFGGDGPWNGQLFHVEQFEIGRNDEGFRCFLTVKHTVGDGLFYGATDGDLRWVFTVTVAGRFKPLRS